MCIHIESYLHHLWAKYILIERLAYIVGEGVGNLKNSMNSVHIKQNRLRLNRIQKVFFPSLYSITAYNGRGGQFNFYLKCLNSVHIKQKSSKIK